MAEQVRRDDTVFLGQLGNDRLPGGRTAGHPVDQQQGGTVTGIPVGDPVSVQFEVRQFAHVNRFIHSLVGRLGGLEASVGVALRQRGPRHYL